MKKIRILHSSSEIPDEQWSKLTGNSYESKGWFRANEEFFKNGNFYYLCAYDNDICEAILPVYDFLPKVYKIPFGAYYGRFAGFAWNLKYLISGSPYSNNSDVIGNRACQGLLLDALINLAKNKSKDAICFPYTDRPLDECHIRDSRTEYVLFLPGLCMKDYLSSLSGKRRYSVNREIKSCDDVNFEHHAFAGYEDQMKRFYDMTCDKYANENQKGFSKDFYQAVSAYMGDNARISLALKEGELKGMLFYMIDKNCISVFHVGVPSKDFIYFNLVYYDVISLAYRKGISIIDFRFGSDEAKLARGCVPIPRYISMLPVSLKAKAFTKIVQSGQTVLKHARQASIKSGKVNLTSLG